MQFSLTAALALGMLTVCTSALASTIAEAPNLTLVTTLPYFGQSFTVTGSGQFDKIAVTFFSTNPDYPRPNDHFANGDGYLFSSIYNGPFNGLPTATDDLLGVGHASDGSYYFSPDVTLDAGKQYFFYSGGINYSGLAAADTSYQEGSRTSVEERTVLFTQTCL